MRLISERTRLRFSELFAGVTSRTEVVVTFLALLELIRLKQLTALQEQAFGEIEICRAETAAGVPGSTGGEPAGQMGPAAGEPPAETHEPRVDPETSNQQSV